MENRSRRHHADQPPNLQEVAPPLSLDHPIDQAVAVYIKQIQNDNTPTQLDQKEILKSLQQENDESEATLKALNQGLVATLAYGFKASTHDNSEELMNAGFSALIDAASTYDLKHSQQSFTNYAVPFIEAAMRATAPEIEPPYALSDATPPLYTIYKFLSTLTRAETPKNTTPKRNIEVAPGVQSGNQFTPFEMKVIPHLYLETSAIMEASGLTNMVVQMAIRRAARRAQVRSRQALALHLLQNGYPYVIPEPVVPLQQLFHQQQITMIQQLHLPITELANLHDTTEHALSSFIYQAQLQTGAKTLTELLLMSHIYGPTEPEKMDEPADHEKSVTVLGRVAIQPVAQIAPRFRS